MFKNLLKVMIRNFNKHKVFSLINVTGLAIWMACCLLILLFISDELSFDRYNTQGDRVYRLNSHSTIGGTTRHFAASPAALAPAMRETIPEVLAYARVADMGRAQFAYEGKNIGIPDFFAAGDVPKNSHFRFAILLSTSTFRQPELNPIPSGQLQRNPLDEFYAFGVHSYVVVDRNTGMAALDRKVRGLVETRWGTFLRQRGVGRWYELQKLFDIHLRSSYEGELGSPGNFQYVVLFGAIALLVLFIACFNFVNLSTARANPSETLRYE